MKAKIASTRHILQTYPLSAACFVTIWVLCLMPVPETPLSHVRLIDKWAHVVMFGGFSLVAWAEYGLHHPAFSMRRALLAAFAIPTLTGALVEIAQATCTGGRRSGDPIDFVADAIGTVLALLIGIPLARMLSRRNRDS